MLSNMWRIVYSRGRIQNIVGIYVENLHNQNLQCVIWMGFDHKNLNEKGHRPLLLEDPLILKLAWQENDLHHLMPRTQFSQDSQDLNKIVAVCHSQRLDSKPGMDTIEICDDNHEMNVEKSSCGFDVTGILMKLCLSPACAKILMSKTGALQENVRTVLIDK